MNESVVRVGNGRGFVMAMESESGVLDTVIVTAAHCLPILPPATPLAYLKEKTFKDLVGPLQGKELFWVECVFVDPVSDIAVLSCPDLQALPKEAEAFEDFVGDRSRLLLARDLPLVKPWEMKNDYMQVNGQVLSLQGKDWLECRVSLGRSLGVHGLALEGGMSGSPIRVDHRAAGIVSVGFMVNGVDEGEHMGQPRLSEALPGWLLRGLR